MVQIGMDPSFGESTVTIVGITNYYGKPQYILVDADNGKIKFPGNRFRAKLEPGNSLEDCARNRFEEQTGLTLEESLGLRVILSTRGRHNNQWLFKNVFFGRVDDLGNRGKQDIPRGVYVANPDEFCRSCFSAGNSKRSQRIQWVAKDNAEIAKIAAHMIHDPLYYSQIPCLSATPLTDTSSSELGCALSVASIFLEYRPQAGGPNNVILVQRKGDDFPGYPGGKIETPLNANSGNLDPISCCIAEGSEELGFPIVPKALLGVSISPLNVPEGCHYNAIVNYSFLASPVNNLAVEAALRNPRDHLEPKMERYVVEGLDEHRDRLGRGEMRMPDMIGVGEMVYSGSPGRNIPLTHIRHSGSF